MEYCSGGDLKSLLKVDKQLPIPAVKLFGGDLLSGLQYLHHNGLLDFNEFVGLQVRSRARELERHAAELGQRATRGMPTHAELYARATRRKSTRGILH